MEDYGGSSHGQIKKRIETLVKKAEDGDIYSMKLLAYIYSQGEYLPKDCLAAQAWLRKAGELGSDDAKKELAKLLSRGNGVAHDPQEAFEIYQELMFDCDVDAMMEVGIAYKYGKGVPKDEKKGSFYIKNAFDIELDLAREDW